MSESTGRILPDGATPIAEGHHYDVLKKAIPASLLDASAERRASLKSLSPRIPSWYASMTPGQKKYLKPLIDARLTSQNALDQHLSKVQSLEAFAQPLLDAALKAKGLTLDVTQVYLRLYVPAVDAFGVKTGGYSARTLSLLQAALHNFEQPETEANYFGPESTFITPPDHLGRFQLYSTSLKIETFAQLCRDLDIGAQYQAYLKPFLAPDEPVSQGVLEHRFFTQKKAMLKLDAQIALYKKDISRQDYEAIQFVINGERNIQIDEQQLWYRTPCVMGIKLHGCVEFSFCEKDRYPTDLIVWIPGDPEHPLKWYASYDDFRDELVRKLTARSTTLRQTAFTPYQDFLSRFITQSDRPYFYKRLTELIEDAPDQPWGVEWFRSEKTQWWIHALAPQVSLALIVPANPERHQRRVLKDHPSINVYSTTMNDAGLWVDLDLWSELLKEMRTKTFADAQTMAISTAMADANNHSLRVSHYLNIGLFAVNLVAMVIPPLGEIMMVVMAGQLLYETLEGFVEWSQGDQEAAWAHLSDVLENLATLAVGAGVFHVASPVIERLKVIVFADGSLKLWNADLSPYERSIEIPQTDLPDESGLYTVNRQTVLPLEGKNYVLQRDRLSDHYRARHPTDPHAYNPEFTHLGYGVWVHEGEQPLTWDLAKLKSRLGTLSADISDADFNHVLKVCDVEEGGLRRMYVEREPVPGKLVDTLGQFKAYAKAMKAVAETRAGRLSPELCTYSVIFTAEMPGWPSGKAFDVYDAALPQVKAKRYGSPSATGIDVITISREELMAGKLPEQVTKALSVPEMEAMLGSQTPSDAGQRALDFQKQLAQHMEKNIHSLFTSLYDEPVLDSMPASETLRLIKRMYSRLTTAMAQRLVAEASPAETVRFKEGRISLRLLEIGRRWQREARLSSAYSGLHLEGLITADTENLVLNSLEHLPGWTNNLRIEVRNNTFSGRLRASVGQSDASDKKVLVRTGEGRYVAHDQRGEILSAEGNLYNSLQHALPDAYRKALGVPSVGEWGALKEKIQQHPVPRPYLRNVLRMTQDNPPAFGPDPRWPDGRLGYGLSGRGAVGNTLDHEESLKVRVKKLYPGISDQAVSKFMTQEGERPDVRIRALEKELNDLDTTLERWITSDIDGVKPGEGEDGSVWDRQRVVLKHRHAVKSMLKRAWHRSGAAHIDTARNRYLGQALKFTEPGMGPVLESLPPLTADFGHVSQLILDNIGATDGIDGFISQFSRLKMLDITRGELTLLPPAIGQMRHLQRLDLSSNHIVLTLESVSQLSRLHLMQYLTLQKNLINLPPDISKMPKLMGLDLRECRVSEWPKGLLASERPREFQLFLDDNPISTIPDVAPGSHKANTLARAIVNYDDLRFEVVQKLKLYREALGLDPERQLPPAHEGGSGDWLRGLKPEEVKTNQEVWNRIEDQHGSEPLFNLFRQQADNAKYRPSKAILDIQGKVWRMLNALDDSETLRDRIFLMAKAPATCVDAGAQLFNALGVEVLLDDAYRAPQPWLVRLEVFDLARGKARLNKLGEIARARIKELEDQGYRLPIYDENGDPEPNLLDGVRVRDIDEVEIYLKYTTSLAERLDLPWETADMVFPESFVTDAMIEAAYRTVRALEEGTGLRNQLVELPMWMDFLERSEPSAFEPLKKKIDALTNLKVAQEKLVEQGASLSEKKKAVLRQEIQADAATLSLKAAPGEVLSDDDYYAKLTALDGEVKALRVSLTDKVIKPRE